MKHDEACPGCATDRDMKETGGALVRDYLAWCAACGKSIQGDTEHAVGEKTYHGRCVPLSQAVEERPK